MMHIRRRRVVVSLCMALTAILASACGASQGFGSGDETGSTEVRLVQQPWEDLVVENQIVSQILDKLGYSAKIQELSVPLGAQALATGDADVYLGNWWPSQKSVFNKHLESGDVEVLGTLVTGTTYAPAVPKFVADEHGIRSLADLASNADLFGAKFLGIEPGTPGNQYIQDAIDQNAYDLGDWQLVQSSTPAMLAEVERHVGKEKPVVFLGWEPHWMNVDWDLVYLDDPKQVWPGAGEIRVAANKNFAAENPNVSRFLSQMSIDRDTASEWIYQLSKKNTPAEEIARNWLGQNSDVVSKWLRGVKTADGTPAEEVA